MSWLEDFLYRKTHVINSATGAGTNYQKRIKVHKSPSFSLGSAINIKANNAHQGIATDGTYIYTTSSDHIYKYTKDGTPQTSRDTSGDGSYGDHNGDLCAVGGRLYIGTCNYPDSPHHAAISVYQASDLSYIGEYLFSDEPDWISGVSHKDGYFYCIWGNNKRVIWKMSLSGDTSFTKEAEYDLPAPIFTGDYQGCDWYDDYMFCTIHGGGALEEVHVYYFTGTDFLLHQRLPMITWSAVGWSGTAEASQGLSIENDGGAYYVWWASRGNPSPPGNDFAKSLLGIVASDSGEDVYAIEKCKNDFGDIRFTKDDGITELDYWIEECLEGSVATFWIKVPEDLSSENKTIYIYYGKLDATYPFGNDQAKMDAVFLFADHFYGGSIDTNKWNTLGDPTVSDGEAHLDNDDGIHSKTTYGNGHAFVARSKCDEQDVEFLAAAEEGGEHNNILSIQNSDATGPDDFDKYKFPQSKKEGVVNDYLYTTYLDFRNVFFIYQVIKVSNSKVIVYQDTITLTRTNSTYIPTVNLRIRFHVWDSSQESQLDIDYCYIRKYVDPEPTNGSWGSEEESPYKYERNLTISHPGLKRVKIKNPSGTVIYDSGILSDISENIFTTLHGVTIVDYPGLYTLITTTLDGTEHTRLFNITAS